jgi:hypothetical protein
VVIRGTVVRGNRTREATLVVKLVLQLGFKERSNDNALPTGELAHISPLLKALFLP